LFYDEDCGDGTTEDTDDQIAWPAV